MKKIKLILFFLIAVFIFSVEYRAKELIQEEVDNVWIFKKGGGKKAYSAKYIKYSIDGLTTYCVEPGIPITTSEYVDLNGWSSSPYDEDLTNKLQLIGYYGYDYPGHNTLEYRMATQALIWELTGGQIVEYWTEKSGSGNYISVKKEKEEIMNLVNSYKKANFDKNEITVNFGKDVVFTDMNNVLNQYEIINGNAKIDNNKIILNQNKFGKNSVSLKRKHYTDKVTTLYAGIDETSQKMGYFGLFDDEIITLQANSLVKAKLKVIKVDEETNEIIKDINFKFKIKNLDTSTYIGNEMIFETKNGSFTTPFYLDKGTYELEELNGNYDKYIYNPEPLKFVIDENSNYNLDNDITLEVIFKNNPIKGELLIYKTGEIPFEDEEIKLNDVEFLLYADENIYNNSQEVIYKKNDLIGKYITKDGFIKIEDLYCGNYYLKEIKTNTDYILDNKKISFEIKNQNDNNQIVKIEFHIKNKLKTGSFELTKRDISTGDVIPGATIQIFRDDKLIYKGKTDEKGTIYVKDLPIGKYKFIESDAPIGYILNTDEHTFLIKENGEVVKGVLTNEKITGNFELTKKDISTGDVIPGATISIYDSKGKLFYKGVTNNEGKIFVSNIPYGKYKFVESDAPIGYILNTDEHVFEIKENGEIIKDILLNEKINVPNTFMNNNFPLSYFILISAILLKIYEKKHI